MLLTADEYRRGMVDGRADDLTAARVWLRTSQDGVFRGPYLLSGSVLHARPDTRTEIELELFRPVDIERLRIRCQGRTLLYSPSAGVTQRFIQSMDIGTSFRRVLRPTHVNWRESRILVEDPFRVHFSLEEVRVSQAQGYEGNHLDEGGNPVLTGEILDVVEPGPLVEILVEEKGKYGEEIEERLRGRADALEGILALILGEGVLGPVVHEEFPRTRADDKSSVFQESSSFYVPNVYTPPAAEVDSATAALISKSRDAADGNRLESGLRWYAKGARSDLRVDSFVSFFVGIESLTSTWFASKTWPKRTGAQEARALFDKLPDVPSSLRQEVLSKLSEYPLAEQFSAYWASLTAHPSIPALVKGFGSRFSALNRERNNILHGRVQDVDAALVERAALLLRTILALELGLPRIATRKTDLGRYAIQYKWTPPPGWSDDP
jgi:hypothetical protein